MKKFKKIEKKMKVSKILLSIFLAVSIIVMGGCNNSGNSTSDSVSNVKNKSDNGIIYELDDAEISNNAVPADTSPNNTNSSDGTSLKMSFAGDYIIYDSNYNYANQLANGSGYNFAPMIKNLKQFTENCDLNYYNQETILGGTELGLSSYPTFNSPQEAGDAMIDLGYNLVSTATNHTMDAGEEGILSSYKYWKSKDNVFMTGSFDSQRSRDEVHVLECNGITYSMLNYTYGTNGIPVPEDKDYLVNIWPCDFTDPKTDTDYQSYKKQVKKDIHAVRDKVDFLIVCMHAGVEYAAEESDYQDDMARFLADNGVNLVIGTHPHVIEPAEYIGDTLVYYSMGNLYCAQMQDEYYNKVTSILATVTVKKTVENGETKITFEDLSNEIMYCYYNQATWADYYIVPFSSPEIKEYLPEYKDVYEYYKEIFLQKDKSLPVAPCAK